MAQLVDSYANALKTFDPSAWLLFNALRDKVVQSAEQLLQSFEQKALRPPLGVADDFFPASETEEASASAFFHNSRSPAQPREAASQLRGGEIGRDGGLLSQVDGGAAQLRAASNADGLTLRERLERELALLTQYHAHVTAAGATAPTAAASTTPASGSTASVFCQLSPPSRTVLAFTAMWMTTKFWGSVSESSTLSGLVACFIQQQQQQEQQQQEQQQEEQQPWLSNSRSPMVSSGQDNREGALHTPRSELGGVKAATPTRGGARLACPLSLDNSGVVTVCSASTPPRSPVEALSSSSALHAEKMGAPHENMTLFPATAATPMAARTSVTMGCGKVESSFAYTLKSKGEEEAKRAVALPSLPDEGGQLMAALNIRDYDDVPGYAQLLPPQPAMWFDGVSDLVDEIARDVEDAEIMLLRCSEYSIPV